MSSRRRAIFRNVQAAELPERFRDGLSPEAHVNVTIEEQSAARKVRLSEMIGLGQGLYGSPEEVVMAIREMRDADD